jgi:hypothetical protein
VCATRPLKAQQFTGSENELSETAPALSKTLTHGSSGNLLGEFSAKILPKRPVDYIPDSKPSIARADSKPAIPEKPKPADASGVAN